MLSYLIQFVCDDDDDDELVGMLQMNYRSHKIVFI